MSDKAIYNVDKGSNFYLVIFIMYLVFSTDIKRRISYKKIAGITTATVGN